MSRLRLRVGISVGALGIVAVHLALPSLKIDVITFGLLLVALLPWAADLIKSAEFPGGWKVEFRDLARAGSKIAGEAPEGPGSADARTAHGPTTPDDPNLALVGLRISIEDKLRQLAKLAGVSSTRSLMIVFRQLKEKGVITEPSASGLHELIIAGNQAAHGAPVDPSAVSWTMEHGPRILGVLDQAIQREARQRL